MVDVETARDNAATAQHDLETSRQSVKDANIAIAGAQHRFDTFAAATYMNGPSNSYLTASSPDDIIATEAAAKNLTTSSQTVMAKLQQARTEQVNKESAARLAKQNADKAAADAKSSQDAAVAALTNSKQKFDQQREDIFALPPSGTRRIMSSRCSSNFCLELVSAATAAAWLDLAPAAALSAFCLASRTTNCLFTCSVQGLL